MELYKKYRPKTWEEVIGQDTVVSTLKHEIKTGKIPTAILFSGIQGSGKTTLAKLLAKALNCEHLTEELNPCNTCPSCQSIDNDTKLGFKYISMGNNAGVDEVRAIMKESYLTQPCKKKVFILDEVQNCSKAAFDSMLIPLEDEQQDTLFILCTTAPEKVDKAVMTRTQHFHLRQPTVSELAKYLYTLVQKDEELQTSFHETDSKTLKNILISCAVNAHGSVRQALQNLEKAAVDGQTQEGYTQKLLELLAKRDAPAMYRLVDQMSEESVNLNEEMQSLYKAFSTMLVAKAGGKVSQTLINDYASKFSSNFILVTLKELGSAMCLATNQVIDYRYIYENSLLKLILSKVV